MTWDKLIGKKVAAYRGYAGKTVALDYILFDDGETYLELSEQDRYDYHDCNHSARVLQLWQNAEAWKKMMEKDGFGEPSDLGHDPF